jgi:hypothetical protein
MLQRLDAISRFRAALDTEAAHAADQYVPIVLDIVDNEDIRPGSAHDAAREQGAVVSFDKRKR